MKCKFCDNEMELDDKDIKFKGNQDNYWLCEFCGSSCFEKIRYGRTISKCFKKAGENNDIKSL